MITTDAIDGSGDIPIVNYQPSDEAPIDTIITYPWKTPLSPDTPPIIDNPPIIDYQPVDPEASGIFEPVRNVLSPTVSTGISANPLLPGVGLELPAQIVTEGNQVVPTGYGDSPAPNIPIISSVFNFKPLVKPIEPTPTVAGTLPDAPTNISFPGLDSLQNLFNSFRQTQPTIPPSSGSSQGGVVVIPGNTPVAPPPTSNSKILIILAVVGIVVTFIAHYYFKHHG